MAGANRSAVPFFVAFGGEDFLLDRDIEKARSWKNRQVTLVDGVGKDDYEIVSMCEAEATDGVARTIIVDNANKVKGDKYLKEYITKKIPTDASVILVAVIRAEKLPEIWSSAASKGQGVERKKLKTWDDNNEVVKWVNAEALRLGVSFEKGIDLLFYQNVGSDLYRLSNELKKLALLVGDAGKIAKEHLVKVTSASPVAESFHVAEAAMIKDRKRAMNSLSILYKNQGEKALVPVVYALMRQVEKTLIARRLLDKGTSEADVAVALGVKPWVFQKSILPQARQHGAKDLVRHMGRLCKLDVDVKGPAHSKRTLVELAVLAIAG